MKSTAKESELVNVKVKFKERVVSESKEDLRVDKRTLRGH